MEPQKSLCRLWFSLWVGCAASEGTGKNLVMILLAPWKDHSSCWLGIACKGPMCRRPVWRPLPWSGGETVGTQSRQWGSWMYSWSKTSRICWWIVYGCKRKESRIIPRFLVYPTGKWSCLLLIWGRILQKPFCVCVVNQGLWNMLCSRCSLELKVQKLRREWDLESNVPWRDSGLI